jgi:hypothetical protein
MLVEGATMVDITIEISDEALRALEEQAVQNGRNPERRNVAYPQ